MCFLITNCYTFLQKDQNQSPFIPNSHGNPAFHPQKISKAAVSIFKICIHSIIVINNY